MPSTGGDDDSTTHRNAECRIHRAASAIPIRIGTNSIIDSTHAQ